MMIPPHVLKSLRTVVNHFHEDERLDYEVVLAEAGGHKHRNHPAAASHIFHHLKVLRAFVDKLGK